VVDSSVCNLLDIGFQVLQNSLVFGDFLVLGRYFLSNHLDFPVTLVFDLLQVLVLEF
jgi:hypothetical protein